MSFFMIFLYTDMSFGLYRMTKARVLTMDDMEKMENDNIIVLTDEDGIECGI